MNDTTKLYLSTIRDDVKETKESVREIAKKVEVISDKLDAHVVDDTRRFDRLGNHVMDIQNAANEVALQNAERVKEKRGQRNAIWLAIIAAVVTAIMSLATTVITTRSNGKHEETQKK